MADTATVSEAPPEKLEQYRVVEGIHFERNSEWEGKVSHPKALIKYTKGQVVVSGRDLLSQYPNKFEKIMPGINAPIVVSQERKDAVNLLVEQGRATEEERKMLEELPEPAFDFIRLRMLPAANRDAPSSLLGEDVTDAFGFAYDSAFKVYRNASGKHQVSSCANPKKVLNLEPLAANQVEKFIKDYLKENKK